MVESDLMSVLAATVKRLDEVWFMGELHVVEHVANATPTDGKITWTLRGVQDPVTVSATRKVSLKRC